MKMLMQEYDLSNAVDLKTVLTGFLVCIKPENSQTSFYNLLKMLVL